MRVTKFFLAQYLVEVDMTERPHFDDFDVDEYFSSALRLSGRDKKLNIKVFRLGAKPNSREDVVIESYEYRGYPIKIWQDANTVGADIRNYFSTVGSIHTKTYSDRVVAESEQVEVVKKAAEESVDYKFR